jgi:hypothetical protein
LKEIPSLLILCLKLVVEREKNRIIALQQDEGLIEGDVNILRYATDFYKSFLGLVKMLVMLF